MHKKRNLLLAIIVIVAIFVINHVLTPEMFSGLENTYLAEFLLKLKCAVSAFLGAVVLKKLWIYCRFDTALLKKGWSAGVFELVFMLYMLVVFFLSR